MSNHLPPRLTSGLKRIKSTRVRALLSIGMVFGLGAVGTLAYWTDSATLTGGTFTAGTLDIKLGNPSVDNNPPAFATSLALANMQPGNSKAAVVNVQNAGSIDFTYTATGLAGGALAPFLSFNVRVGGSVSGTGNSQTCTGGTSTFTGTLTAAAQPVIAANQPLNAGANGDVCVSATLPATETGGQGLSTTSTFSFAAKQVGAP